MKILKGTQAELLAEGCKLTRTKKEIESRLKEIKKELKLKQEGTYTNNAKDIVVYASKPKYSDIDPKLLFRYMKDNKMLKYYWGCVKPQLTQLKKQVPESKINTWRRQLDSIYIYTFK